ncbi:DUF1643 domain-containing protein [Pasteurella skyensis]|uniref:DUF1643 domain-containing protein n=1 Tax=Phocoenobacter skyensis TaxID=97481 RepID=A0AAJ6N9B1_9PAST|nr:DUF1643 domain-containing protein [Pasteurella skyensis]MDP8162892.1 DUF1643 domain-containing protein [Pasteurella skyensis]MDP8172521.1 DUF1643 domain-containing protein [Pasteurella skyensis]MDP8177716.1 DUF1643 domain-containing protein [Pasteurella skyensis]MDP8179021.1 DUF1643 domain-containing protein [Pasteurella skyensis]MDP8183294.1 DUF1643 domain-containing protein [Pasteurella skyensis]
MYFKHIDNVDVQAVFSNNYRYSLEITKNNTNNGKTVCVIMQNPSEANKERADKSVQFIEKLIFLKGYSEFANVRKIIIVNQFAYIQKKGFQGLDEHIGVDNDKYIKESIEKSEIVLIAWGVSNTCYDRQNEINRILAKYENKVLLQTKKHPSRGTYKDFIEKYEI